MFKERKDEDVTQGLSNGGREEMNLKGMRRENQQDSISNQKKEGQGWWPNPAKHLSASVGTTLPDKSPETNKDLVLVCILDWKLSASFPGYNPMGIHDVYIYTLCLPRLRSVVT